MAGFEFAAIEVGLAGVDRVVVVEAQAVVHGDLLVAPVDVVGVGVQRQGAVEPGRSQRCLVVPGEFRIIGDHLRAGGVEAGAARAIAALHDERRVDGVREVVADPDLG